MLHPTLMTKYSGWTSLVHVSRQADMRDFRNSPLSHSNMALRANDFFSFSAVKQG